jgi:hypothetical protein
MATQLLKLKSCKTTVIHALQPRDSAGRVHFCSWFLQCAVEGEIDLQLTLFSDDVWFHLPGYVITQNNHYWSSQNPHLTHEVPLHPVKVGVWCAVSARRVLGSLFCNETVNCKKYVWIILGQFFPELTEEEPYGFFQQDLATAHTARTRIFMQALSYVFEDRIISSGIWPARSPDLNPCDFFFWGCLKDRVYSSNP